MIKKKNKLTLIEWVDAYSIYKEWGFINHMAEPFLNKCLSVGWIIRETDECVILMPNISDTQSKKTLGAAFGGIVIPKLSITKRKELKQFK